MKVVILQEADRRIKETAEYIRTEFGRQSEQKFKYALRKVVNLLQDNPQLGPLEPLLAERASAYRSIVMGRLNKVVYRIVDDRIEIVDLWDCRREPKKQAAKTI